MKINLLLPSRPDVPVGGIKIMYEYANHLLERGHQITILYLHSKYNSYSYLSYWFSRKSKERRNSRNPYWFSFHPACTFKYIRSIDERDIPDADILMYTWWELGFAVEKLSDKKGKKVNLIQGYEIWNGDIENVHASYDLKNIHNIVISTELNDLLKQYTQKPSFLLYNAIDTSKFHITIPIKNRDAASVCMLYHTLPLKGSIYGINALIKAKKEIPELKAIFFSVYKKPEDLPDWIEFHQDPKDLCAIYNRAAIFITNSTQEGWPLPPAEAMHCGCALICTNIGGHKDYATPQNAITVEPQNADQMAHSMIRLIKNPTKRIQLATAGNQFIQKFSWDENIHALENFFDKLII